MTRRWTLLAAALTLGLGGLGVPATASAASPAASPQATPEPTAEPIEATPDPAAADALRELRADADGAVRVHRDAGGDVAFVGSADGQAMVDSDASTPRQSAQQDLARYGDAFGIDGDTSRAVVTQTIDSATGGSVVRAQQVVDGVPVFGGQVVMSLDEDHGLVSVSSATTEATQVPAPHVSESTARQTALSVTAGAHRVRAGDLTVSTVGRRIFDPSIMHTTDPSGARPVWQLEVTNGSDVRETVLVGTGRGEVALHFNDAPGIRRRICDYNNQRTPTGGLAVPLCGAAARSEGGPVSGVSDVNKAYDYLGETSTAYSELAPGTDLTNLIGTEVSSQKVLHASVRWCYVTTESPDPCPYDNAFWDGRQMVFGNGYAAADDVVGHELTHGFVERTAALYTFHQSGALNESLADTLGEIIDHRNGSDDDAAWTVGEDLPGGVLRSMKNPLLYNQPDKMTSLNYVTADVSDDYGAVHANNGVGNKTAYLISQGGTFNGHTVVGIDGSDPKLTKTGTLYLAAIPRLTSGAEYADLGRVLAATCDELAAAQKAGFTTADCTSVREAALATELAQQPDDPTAAAPEADSTCPGGSFLALAKQDDDSVQNLGLSLGALWFRVAAGTEVSYAHSGSSSLFAYDPSPEAPPVGYGDPQTSDATTAGFVVPTGSPTYVHFHQAYLFEWYPPANGAEAQYPDGGQVIVQTLENGTWTDQPSVSWVNGPDNVLPGYGAGWGGDSHGYGSSRVDLSPLAGKTARIVFRVVGNATNYFLGWWVDDIRMYSCLSDSPSQVRSLSAAAASTSATVSWQAPSWPGGGVGSYLVTRSDGVTTTVPGTSTSTTLSGLSPTAATRVDVTARSAGGAQWYPVSVTIYPTVTALTAPTTKVVKGRAFTVTAKVTRRGASALVAGMPVTLQRRVKGETTWRTVSTASTSSAGTRSWSVKQSQLTYYRAVSKGASTWLGSTSSTRTVSVR